MNNLKFLNSVDIDNFGFTLPFFGRIVYPQLEFHIQQVQSCECVLCYSITIDAIQHSGNPVCCPL